MEGETNPESNSDPQDAEEAKKSPQPSLEPELLPGTQLLKGDISVLKQLLEDGLSLLSESDLEGTNFKCFSRNFLSISTKLERNE